ncbi:solute carrier family 23 protein [Pseudomonas sp. NCCP-436]|uniref:solute carrier family 23 protein n=1 Tax=Pseudomonas sp. NCCP-436 TaxID=2842481 RepID=UPI001C80386B|nr:solute carrier family 23 protein [Pseudomonas sp. NCCP-436]GIZ12127.1 hypothetical protein NCCP436_15430 [Pseudomonas sp. NCCP-436]
MTIDRNTTAAPELIYQLDNTPAFFSALFAALQNMLASFVDIITLPLIVGSALALFLMLGAVLQLMPEPVLDGASPVIYGIVALAGGRILSEASLPRRHKHIVSISLGLGLSAAAMPEALTQIPEMLRNIPGVPIAIGAFCAIALNIFLPEEPLAEDDYEPEAQLHTVLQNRTTDDEADSLDFLVRDLHEAIRPS